MRLKYIFFSLFVLISCEMNQNNYIQPSSPSPTVIPTPEIEPTPNPYDKDKLEPYRTSPAFFETESYCESITDEIQMR